jgi:hypothetical protein
MASNYDVHSPPPERAQQIQNNTSINNTSTIYIIHIYIKALIIAKLTYFHRSKTCCQTLKHFDNLLATGRNNIVEVFESLTRNFF